MAEKKLKKVRLFYRRKMENCQEKNEDKGDRVKDVFVKDAQVKDVFIKDVIHRFVHVPKLCQKFMDSPEFSRLRRIRQLGLVHYVYPSAVHTRFEHSVGVMHLAGKVAEHLNRQYPGLISPREIELLQLAGLFHDAGHTAFSHLMDYILEEEKNLEEEKEEKKSLTGDLTVHIEDLTKHENRSVFILRKINQRVQALSEEELNVVSGMIHGSPPQSSPQSSPNPAGSPSPSPNRFLYEIVSNKTFGLDVDRLDYLQRDMYHTGMPCFQADYIMECIRVTDGKLAVLKKALPELEAMYEARKRLLLLVCRHKTVMKVEFLIRQAISTMGITGEWFEKNWLSLDDGRAHCMMEDLCPEILHRIYTRDWPEINMDSRYNHISLVTREDIDREIGKVVWE